jgi:DNA-binding NtrC family response regulator
VEIADGGTLFLDEVGEMPLSIQPKLLRFLQTGEFRRVGGNKNLKSDVRIVSATNKDLRIETAAKRFREDLLYRLNVVTLQLPALRDRKDDIPLLISHFLASRAGTKQPKRVDERALDLLTKYDWPGNVRELENVIERAAILSDDDMICLDDVALPIRSESEGESSSEGRAHGARAGSAISLLDIQKMHVERVLASVSWDKPLAAKILGIRLNTLYSKIRTYRLKEPT